MKHESNSFESALVSSVFTSPHNLHRSPHVIEGNMWREDEEDISSYRMTLGKREDTGKRGSTSWLCVWWTRFGRSYGPVADRLCDDDDDTNMSPIQGRSLDTMAVGRNGKRLRTSYLAVRCRYAVLQSSILVLQSTLYYLAIYSVVKCNLLFPLHTKFHVSLLDHWRPHELLKHANHVQTFLKLTLEKTWLLWRLRQQALPCSCAYTNITVSHNRPTNVYIYY